MNTTAIVARTCSRVDRVDGDPITRRPLEFFREQSAYVLLGDPGSGKTCAFQIEATASGGEYIVARDFLAFDPKPEWKSRILFIDGLDETRAGGADGKTPLDRIREKLDKLGKPRFRLSCREADWLGASDRNALERVSPDGTTTVLHLDPLTLEQVLQIIQQHKSDPKGFVKAATDRGLEGMLYNPQTLLLLIDAVKDDIWPDTREETFEMACKALVQEVNVEHRKTRNSNQITLEQLLEASGYLCSVQLLTATTGFATDRYTATDGFIDIDRLINSGAPLRDAIKTKLFKGAGQELFVPLHRSVAEYLSARYLASRIEKQGLPVGRVLALMLGTDGGVVADLRGLHAWLATHHKSDRYSLIMNDPLGVVLYGDVSRFSEGDKRFILEGLNRLAKNYAGFRWEDWTSSPFGALGTPDMTPVFREILESLSRADSDQALVDCVLDALYHGSRLVELNELLLRVVEDSSRWPHVRKRALEVMLLDKNNDPQLLKLLDNIQAGRIEDRDDELLAHLLEAFYPKFIGVDQIFDYFHEPKALELIGNYVDFWARQLPKATPDKDLPLLLDKLANKDLNFSKVETEYHVSLIVGTLVVKGVELFGETITPGRLYTWLGISMDKYRHRRFEKKYGEKLKNWLSSHPEQYKSLIAFAVSECKSEEDLHHAEYKYSARLFYAEPPEDLGIWYLQQSKQASDEKVAHFYFKQAVYKLYAQRGHAGLSLELFETIASKSPKHKKWLQPLLVCDVSDTHLELTESHRKYSAEQKSQKGKWISQFRKHISSIRDGSAPPALLHDLGAAYFGHYYEASGDHPLERLNNFVDGNQDLIDIILAGLRQVLSRSDLPTPAEIFALDAKGRTYFIRLPCLAGIAELYRSDPRHVLGMDEALLSKVLAFHFTYGVGEDPEWYSALVKTRPEVVADVFTTYALRAIQRGKEHVSGVYSLTHDDLFGEVARRAVPRLMSGFPTRTRKGQLGPLEYILKGGIRHVQKSDLSPIIDKKLSNRSLDVGQRVYWLACGLIVAPGKYEAKLRKYIGADQRRSRYLGNFLSGRDEKWIADHDLPASSLGLLIELLGPGLSPDRPVGAHWVTESMEIADLVGSYINRLGSLATDEASKELDSLLKKSQLGSWHNSIKRVRESQRVSRREATFLRPSLEAVTQTLSNLQPANPADLAALAYDHLRQIGKKFRHDNTNPYKLFWNEDSNGNPTTPKPENSCRYILLDVLRDRLGKLGIDAQAESEYANSKRADIRVSFGGANGFNVPIEIKHATNRDLWHAIRNQLIARYTRDLGAKGYGIYLVLWFGDVTPSPSGGRKPVDAAELEKRLLESLESQERSLISVLVIDCSAPPRTSRK